MVVNVRNKLTSPQPVTQPSHLFAVIPPKPILFSFNIISFHKSVGLWRNFICWRPVDIKGFSGIPGNPPPILVLCFNRILFYSVSILFNFHNSVVGLWRTFICWILAESKSFRALQEILRFTSKRVAVVFTRKKRKIVKWNSCSCYTCPFFNGRGRGFLEYIFSLFFLKGAWLLRQQGFLLSRWELYLFSI